MMRAWPRFGLEAIRTMLWAVQKIYDACAERNSSIGGRRSIEHDGPGRQLDAGHRALEEPMNQERIRRRDQSDINPWEPDRSPERASLVPLG